MLQIANGNILTELSVKWGTEDIPYTEEAKNLGLWITKDLTWTKHMRAAKQKGYAALSKYRRLLQNNHVHMSVKTSVIKTTNHQVDHICNGSVAATRPTREESLR